MAFDEHTIQSVWEKGSPDANYNSTVWRKDCYGWWMKRSEHGNSDSEYGWEVDHRIPVSKGGSDDLSNLQPLNWKNNAAKNDGR